MPQLRSGTDTSNQQEKKNKTRQRRPSLSTRSGGSQGYRKNLINNLLPNQANKQISKSGQMEIDLQSILDDPVTPSDDLNDLQNDLHIAQHNSNLSITLDPLNQTSSKSNALDIDLSDINTPHIGNFNEEEFEVIPVSTRITGIIQAALIPGNTFKEKTSFVKEIINEIPEFLSINTSIIEEKKYVKATFANIDGYKKGRILLNRNKIILEELIRPSKEEIAAIRDLKAQKKILVKDISIDTSHAAIRTIFEAYGKITACRTSIYGPWKRAEIEFAEEETALAVGKLAAIPIQRDIARIYPWNEIEYIEDLRKECTLKLSNLPYGTTGYDIWNYVKSVGGKTCFIPKSPIKMSRKRHAYISFNNTEDKEAIENKQVSIKGYIAQWISDDVKTCFICEEAGHFAVECQWKKEKQIQQKANTKLATRYNRLGIDSKTVPKPIANIMKKQQTNSSYAAAVKSNIEPNTFNLKKPSVATTVSHMNKNIEERLNHLESRFDKLETALNRIVNHLEKGKFPTFTEPATPNASGIEAVLNESPAYQNPKNWSNFSSSPIGLSTSANVEENSSYQLFTTEASPHIINNNIFAQELQTRCDKLEALATKLIMQMNNNLPEEEQITIDFNSL
jgi:hypothetical protein